MTLCLLSRGDRDPQTDTPPDSGITHRGGEEEGGGGSRSRGGGEDNSKQEGGDPVEVSHCSQRGE